MPAARMASPPGIVRPLIDRFAFADHDLSEMRERRKIARSAHRSLRGNHRMDAAIQHRDERFGTTGRTPEKPLARALARSAIMARVAGSLSGVADAAGVAANQIDLQLADFVAGNATSKPSCRSRC